MLAPQGFNVKASDISTVGIEAIRKFAQEHSLNNLEAYISDVTDGIEGEYDLIVTTFMLHHLETEDALMVIRDIQNHTKNAGLNAITTFTKDGDFYTTNPEGGYFYPELGKMRELYENWEILEYREEKGRAQATRPDGSPMFNTSAYLLARKPA